MWPSVRLQDFKQDTTSALERRIPAAWSKANRCTGTDADGLTKAMTCVSGETLAIKPRSVLKPVKEHYFIVLLPAVVFIESNLYWTTLSVPTRTYWKRIVTRSDIYRKRAGSWLRNFVITYLSIPTSKYSVMQYIALWIHLTEQLNNK